MPSSTLSDALNEFAAHGRPRQNEPHIGAFSQGQIFSPQAQGYPQPVHTEGELVQSEPSPPPAQPLAPRCVAFLLYPNDGLIELPERHLLLAFMPFRSYFG